MLVLARDSDAAEPRFLRQGEVAGTPENGNKMLIRKVDQATLQRETSCARDIAQGVHSYCSE